MASAVQLDMFGLVLFITGCVLAGKYIMGVKGGYIAFFISLVIIRIALPTRTTHSVPVKRADLPSERELELLRSRAAAAAESKNVGLIAQVYMRQYETKCSSEGLRSILSLNQLHAMAPRDFEKFVADFYGRQGYESFLTPAVNDGGYDVVLKKGSEKIAVEVKRYSETNSVGRPDLQKLMGAIAESDFTSAWFITLGPYTEEAREYAKGKSKLRILDGSDFAKALESADIKVVSENVASCVTPLSEADLKKMKFHSYCRECADVTQPGALECVRGHSVSELPSDGILERGLRRFLDDLNSRHRVKLGRYSATSSRPRKKRFGKHRYYGKYRDR